MSSLRPSVTQDVLNKEDWGAAVCDRPFGTNKSHNPRADTCAPEGRLAGGIVLLVTAKSSP